jgi:hypothetical protein
VRYEAKRKILSHRLLASMTILVFISAIPPSIISPIISFSSTVALTYNSKPILVVLYSNGTYQEDVNWKDIEWQNVSRVGIKREDLGIVGFEASYGLLLWYPFYPVNCSQPLMFMAQRAWGQLTINGSWQRFYLQGPMLKTPWFRNNTDGITIGWNGTVTYASYNFSVSLAVRMNQAGNAFYYKTNITTPISLANSGIEYQLYANPDYASQMAKYTNHIRLYYLNGTTQDYAINGTNLDLTYTIPDTIANIGLVTAKGQEFNKFNFTDIFSSSTSRLLQIENVTLPNGANTYVLRIGCAFGSLNATQTLSIDPSTVGTSTNNYAVSNPFQRFTFDACGLHWAIYYNGTHEVYRTSTDGLTWSSIYTISTTATSPGRYSFSFDGTYLHYAMGYTTLKYRKGTPNSNSSISWLATEQTAVSSSSGISYDTPSISSSSDSYPYIGYIYDDTVNGYTYAYVTKSDWTNGSWHTASGFPVSLNSTFNLASICLIVPRTSGSMYVIYDASSQRIRGRLWNGSAWSTEEYVSTTTIGTTTTDLSAINQDDNISLVFNIGVATNSTSSYETGGTDYNDQIYSTFFKGQTFVPAYCGNLLEVRVYLKRGAGTNSVNLNVSLYNTNTNGLPTGANIGTGTISSFTTTTYGWYTISLTPYLIANTKYAIVISASTGSSAQYYQWGGNDTAPYANGTEVYSSNSGSSWASNSTLDLYFRAVQNGYPVKLVQRTTSWGSEVITDYGASDTAPVLSLNSTQNSLVCFFSQQNHIYYRTYLTSWSNLTDWLSETALTANDRLSCFYQAYSNVIGLEYMNSTTSPYQIRYAFFSWGAVYSLNLRVMDYDLADSISGALVYMNNGSDQIKTSDVNGWANYTSISGSVSVKVQYYGFWVNGTFTLTVDADKTINVWSNLYDAVVKTQENAQGAYLVGANVSVFNASSVESNKVGNAITNESGYASFADLPNNTLTFTIYAGSNYNIIIGNTTRTPTTDEQILAPITCDQNYGTISAPWEIILIPSYMIPAKTKGLKRKEKNPKMGLAFRSRYSNDSRNRLNFNSNLRYHISINFCSACSKKKEQTIFFSTIP